MTRVQLIGVGKVFPAHRRSSEPIVAVDDLSIDIATREIHAVIGYSGAGKSTLLRLINGLEQATTGTIIVGDTSITNLTERELRRVRTGVGMIFQQFNLMQSKTVHANIAYPLKVAGMAREQRNARVKELLSFVGLGDKESAYVEQLSGGQKQRVGIARALATNPGVLLADEATSALDPETSKEVLRLLKRVNQEFGITIILITHEMEVVREIADRVTVMEHGRAVEQGDVFDVFSNPATEVAARFVATALPTKPSNEHLRLIRERHPGTLISVTLREGEVDQPLIFSTLAAYGIDVSIVHGGVIEAAGRTFGRVTLELAGEENAVRRAVLKLAEQTEVEEVRA